MRYTKQRDNFSCGPVAILNSLKWAGVNVSYSKYIDFLSELSSCIPSRGTRHIPFEETLRVVGEDFFSIDRVYYPTLKEISTHLQNDGAIVLSHFWRDKNINHRHFLLMVGTSATGNSFYTVNRYRNGPALRISTKNNFKKVELQFQRTDPYYKAWFLTKKEV